MVEMIEGKAAILVIDVQYDFIKEDGAIPCVGGRDMVPRINRLTDAGRKAGIPVIFTQEFHRKEKIDFGRELDGAESYHCMEGTEGVKIVKELKIEQGDYVIKKPRYSAFLKTDLELLLNGLGVMAGDTLIIVGDATNVCVHYTSAEAHQRDYRIRVVEECCAGTSLEEHEASLTAIEYLQAGGRVKLEAMLDAIAKYKK
ncbi:MAG: cysteine hydrolase [Dehalococcoidia bacterium]|nr:MAG: cysteine hydrolase [Dehalococcoidia bacterium]